MLSARAAASVSLALLGTLPAVAQTADGAGEFDQGSFIELEMLAPTQVENVVALGKVWGFLKYHHPLVTQGTLDWDAELFRALPQVLDAPDRAAGNRALVQWMTQLGEPDPCNPCAEASAGAQLTPDLDWIRDEARLGPELCAALARVHRERSTSKEQRYVTFVPGVGNPLFTNEKEYKALADPDTGFRLLALFRFWNAIEYWFPYRDVIGADWDAVLAEFVPRLVAAHGVEGYHGEMLQLIARVNDTHANLVGWTTARPPKGPAMLPVAVRFVEGRLVVTGPMAAKTPDAVAALEIGDVLCALDGRTVEELVQAWSPFCSASNEPTRLRNLAREFTRGPPGPVAVLVERDGARRVLDATRLPEGELDTNPLWKHDLPGPTFRLLTSEVAYLKFSAIRAKDVADHVRAAQGTRGLVLDLRDYPSEFVVFALGQHLVREPTPFASFTAGTAANPGAFEWTEPVVLEPQEPHYAGRIVILIDETSQSQSEYTAMAFRVAPDARVIGSTTAGADGNVSRIALPGGMAASFSGIGVFYPDKSPTQRVGIVPDLVVEPTIAGVREGRDEVLEAALREILGPKTGEAEIRAIARDALAGTGG